ncbi:unnamed protein product [Cuscuta epithymum]|uniref:Uncharacterized protein n=1 Tax=Cuscuta epithymum TaxID=186058 RepID=A0AAV0C6D2_9ASTE|nr:unnamed protein product [Cuscuta epithymum]
MQTDDATLQPFPMNRNLSAIAARCSCV